MIPAKEFLCCLVACLLITKAMVVVSTGCKKVFFRGRSVGARLKNHVIVTHDGVKDVATCRDRCWATNNCQSINYKEVSTVCELNDSDMHQHPEDMDWASAGFIYSGTVNSCSSSPCLYQGKCLADFVNGGYSCACKSGYAGNLCQDEDLCVHNNPCKHGATCTMSSYDTEKYVCVCVRGYTGRKCETDINECSSDPCKRGDCTDNVNGYTCKCERGYTGRHCENEMNFCEPSPCLNGGTCDNGHDKYTCKCAEGFKGNNCETNKDDCPGDNPCRNGGQCIDGLNRFICACVDGFTGPRCETEINECASIPCLNDATCVDKLNGYTCTCAPGYNGTNCENNIDECASSPCLNNATCVDKINGYNCTCVPGYNGTNCENNNLPTTSAATVATSPTSPPVPGGSSSTCKQYYDSGTRASQAYTHVDQTQNTSTDVYCHMGDIPGCGTGGWTLIMRIDGSKTTFKYNSPFWEHPNSYNPADGSDGFTVDKETLLPTYWSTPFTKICVGMKNKTGPGVKWLLINKAADSLHGLLADGIMKQTNLGIQTWKDLFPEQVLHNVCHREGFNAQAKSADDTNTNARIGVIGDDAIDCRSPDSNLGIGIQGWWAHEGGISCGSARSYYTGDISTWCFVFVQ